MNDVAKQILTAVAAATAATLVTGLLTHYLTKQSTIESVAKGTTPLPQGATPKTDAATPQGSTPSPASDEKFADIVRAASSEELGWMEAAAASGGGT